MRLSYKQKLALYFFIVFSLFTIGIVIFEQSREKKFHTEALEEKLDAYTEIVSASLKKNHTFQSSIDSLETNRWSVNAIKSNYVQSIDSVVDLLPANLRMTIIDRQGNVLYDNIIEDNALSENHAERPEIIKAKETGRGSHIRVSSSNNQKYLYYAKQNNDFFIRVAFPYDVQIQDFLKSDNLFLYFIIVLFIVTLLLINYVADRFGKSIKKLKEFALSDEHKVINYQIEFPEDELGVIGRKIIENYEQLRERQKEITLEREKLLLHVHSSGEGLCFFSKDKTVGFYNGLFIQYLNTITDESASDPAIIFTDVSFKKIVEFLSGTPQNEKYFATQISRHGKDFNLQVNIFEDGSFELIINDITRQEKTRLLKQEMTSNIAHELRTPVTSIRGYLEIALEQSLNEKKTRDFLTKAYKQTVVLSELIQDTSLITKMEEAPTSFKQETVYIEELLVSLKNDLEKPLTEKNIHFELKNIHDVTIYGNRNLIYSIFRNLTDNVIRYAGADVNITVNKYNEDIKFYYFSYADTGVGIPGDNHLNRIFERFYRVNEGRTRDTGGSGLGLSIVKNAILFHKGTILAKNRTGGGLEFLFKLPKDKS